VLCVPRATLPALSAHPKPTVWFHCVQAQTVKLPHIMAFASRTRVVQRFLVEHRPSAFEKRRAVTQKKKKA